MVSPKSGGKGAQEKQPEELEAGTPLPGFVIYFFPLPSPPPPTTQVTAHLPFLLGPRSWRPYATDRI